MAQLQRPPTTDKKTPASARPLTLTTLNKPNLLVKISGINYNTTDNTYTVGYIVYNDGADLGDCLIELRGSVSDAAGTATHDGGTADIHLKSLKQGQSYSGKITCSIPLYNWQKNFRYQLVADPDNKIPESNEKDNSAFSSIEGYLDQPDLQIESATFIYQDSILQNNVWKHRFKVRYVLKNNASVAASLDIYISGLFGPTPRTGCSALVSGIRPPSNMKIGPWGTISNELGCTADRATLSNGATYTITINDPMTIEEKNRNNNSFTITIPPIPSKN